MKQSTWDLVKTDWIKHAKEVKSLAPSQIAETYDLRAALQANTPLQKLYEKVHYDSFDLGEAVRKHLGLLTKASDQYDLPESKNVSCQDFKKVIAANVPSIDVDTEFDLLMLVVPKIFKNDKLDNKLYRQTTGSSDDKELLDLTHWKVLYQFLSVEMLNLAHQGLPNAAIYNRFSTNHF